MKYYLIIHNNKDHGVFFLNKTMAQKSARGGIIKEVEIDLMAKNEEISSDFLAYSITIILRYNPAIFPTISKFLINHTVNDLFQRLKE